MPKSFKTTEKFIQEANEIHNFKYDYSKTNYEKSTSKIKIICPIHSEFFQTPNSHLQGQGCPECGKLLKGKNASNTEVFIQKSKKIHSDRYDYSLVEYKNSKTKVKIKCHLHGVFEHVPGYHIYDKSGCPDCSPTLKLTTESFIKKSVEIHRDLYNYSKVNYINNKTKVIITCKIHGEFNQKPNQHLSQQGCPICAKEIGSFTKISFQKQCIRNNNRVRYFIYNPMFQ